MIVSSNLHTQEGDECTVKIPEPRYKEQKRVVIEFTGGESVLPCGVSLSPANAKALMFAIARVLGYGANRRQEDEVTFILE